MSPPCLFDCQSLQRSLKRVRLSSSPGELCLQRDIRDLVLSHNWIPVDEEAWRSPEGYLLERPDSDPLCLALHLRTNASCRLHFPRMYPHQPPLVRRVHSAHIQHILIQEAPPARSGSPCVSSDEDMHVPSHTAVFQQWSPIKRLHDVLEFLINQLDVVSEADRATEPFLEVSMEDQDYKTDLKKTFPPNRFDKGYTKPRMDMEEG